MSSKRNIDRLFQEKLEHFEQEPSPVVWGQIQDRLQQKKKRRFALWWMYAGAAILILGLFVFLPEDPSSKKNPIEPIITSSPKNGDSVLDPNKKENTFQNTDPVKEDQTLITKNSKEEEVQPKKTKRVIQSNKVSKKAIAQNTTVEKTDTEMSNVVVKKQEDTGLKTSNAVVNDHVDPKKTDTKPVVEISEKIEAKKSKVEAQKKKELFTAFNEEIIEDTTQKKKWSLRPLVAFSTIANSSSSPSGQTFRNNATSGNSSVNYGLSVAYHVNDKFILQTGLLTQNISFNTQDVVVTTQPNVFRPESSIDLRQGVSYILSGSSSLVSTGNAAAPSNISFADRDAELNQVISYIEVPMEAKYRISKSKKIRSYLIGGFSSLFLQNNEIILISDVVGRTNVGTANNLNSVSFSGNIGLDVDYEINKNLSLNVNPMFKAHLNTFSANSNGYQPYFLGVYTGLKYTF